MTDTKTLDFNGYDLEVWRRCDRLKQIAAEQVDKWGIEADIRTWRLDSQSGTMMSKTSSVRAQKTEDRRVYDLYLHPKHAHEPDVIRRAVRYELYHILWCERLAQLPLSEKWIVWLWGITYLLVEPFAHYYEK